MASCKSTSFGGLQSQYNGLFLQSWRHTVPFQTDSSVWWVTTCQLSCADSVCLPSPHKQILKHFHVPAIHSKIFALQKGLIKHILVFGSKCIRAAHYWLQLFCSQVVASQTAAIPWPIILCLNTNYPHAGGLNCQPHMSIYQDPGHQSCKVGLQILRIA